MTVAGTGSALVRDATMRLQSAGVPDAARDARRLFSFATGTDASRLTITLPEPVCEAVAAIFEGLVVRRMSREPVSHLTGTRAFYGRDFKVTADVLDPRPETETLVEVALRSNFTKMIDLGTGSGCILVTLLTEVPQSIGYGTDLSGAALEVARTNAARHGVADRATFVCADWMESAKGSFDLIVSNPPYIATNEMSRLSPEVANWEPHMALTDGADGLSHYRTIIKQAVSHLMPDGRLIFEIGPTQGQAVADLMRAAHLQHVTVIPDLDGRDRVVSAQMIGFQPQRRA